MQMRDCYWQQNATHQIRMSVQRSTSYSVGMLGPLVQLFFSNNTIVFGQSFFLTKCVLCVTILVRFTSWKQAPGGINFKSNNNLFSPIS